MSLITLWDSRKRSATAIDMQKEISACFTGYRPQKLPWGFNEADKGCLILKGELRKIIKCAYDTGYTHFISGGAMGVDLYAAEEVIRLKQSANDVTLELAMPFPTLNPAMPGDIKERYEGILLKADKVTVCSEHYSPASYMKRNAYMVDSSSLVIAVYDGQSGGTKNTVDYARKKGKTVWLVHP